MSEATTTAPIERSTIDTGRRVLLVLGAGHFATYALADDGELILGRDPACAVPLMHPSVSRRHARVRGGIGPRTVMVEDLGSTNGVLVAGERLAPGAPTELRPGDSFLIGPFSVLVIGAGVGASLSYDGPVHGAMTVADPTPGGVAPVVTRVARSPVSVLILGETGAGKEVLARTLHELSGRPGPFVGINAAALSETLLESELFGHERGAFTGATQAKAGLLETAPNGTVFLDEIGDLPFALQAKLLRAIETREVFRVGGLKSIALDVRFLAATNRDLAADVCAGRFRSDLYYRLNGFTLLLLPLRERRGAIPELARLFLAEAAAAAGRPTPRLSLAALGKLARHDWPGNVRELRTVVERALLVTSRDEIGERAILVDAEAPALDQHGLIALIQAHRGNVTAIARALATSRSQVHRLAQRFGIDLDKLRTS